MAITNYFVRATNGADVAGQGTTHMTAYQTPQFALDDIGATHGRNTVDGDQINICDTAVEGANVLAAPLSLATYGVPTEAAPLMLRGYTAVANDGGVGEINANGVPLFIVTTYDYVLVVDLYCHDFGNNDGIVLNVNGVVFRCAVTRGASLPNLKTMVRVGAQGLIAGNHIYGGGTNVWGVQPSGACLITGNYVAGFEYVGIKNNADNSVITGNAVLMSGVNSYGIRISTFGGCVVIGNNVYSPDANTKYGIWLAESAGQQAGLCMNNIVCGISGVGGVGIGSATGTTIPMAGYNAFYNCTTNYSIAKTFIDETAHDVALGADPFTNAAGGDFSLTEAAQALLRSAGWPSAYLGASTDPHITIGAVQYGEGGGSGVIRRAMRILGG